VSCSKKCKNTQVGVIQNVQAEWRGSCVSKCVTGFKTSVEHQ